MNDNEIIKALEWCNSLSKRCGNGCPYYEIPYKNGKRCSEMMIDDVIDLINRQKAEIERLNNKYKHLEASSLIFKGGVDYFVKKAIKEFAERLKSLQIGLEISGESLYYIPIDCIDNLVKEMVGNNE